MFLRFSCSFSPMLFLGSFFLRLFFIVFVVFPWFSMLSQALPRVFRRPPSSSRALPGSRTAPPRFPTLSWPFSLRFSWPCVFPSRNPIKPRERRGAAVRGRGRAREDGGGRPKTGPKTWKSVEKHGKMTKTMGKKTAGEEKVKSRKSVLARRRPKQA